MKTYSFQVQDNGQITTDSRQIMANVIAGMASKRIKIAVSEWKESSSERQRRYYFKVIVEAFIEYFSKVGKVFNKEQMHDSMMRSIGGFANPYVNPFSGEPDAGRLSYNDLTTAQAEGYHTLCRQWAAEHDFQIPEPNEVDYERL